jgi:3-hydroxybutyryl-CoA dehydrogenase
VLLATGKKSPKGDAMREKKIAGIVGAGMMGGEIALCFAQKGWETFLLDQSSGLAEKGKSRISGILDKAIGKGKMQEKDKESILSRILPIEEKETLADADLIVEAVFEELETKKKVFIALDPICKPECIFATNTSSIPITLLATAVSKKRIGRFLGCHFFSPASIMKLVEVIPGLETAEETLAFMIEQLRLIDKTPIRVKDVPGFAVNRIFHAMLIEAMRLLEEGVASPEDIDTACKLGLGHPVGPFALMDILNNELNLKVQEILFDGYGERFKPRPILRQKVNARHLGRMTGRGWYEYKK